jgi:hypothetical protein
MEPSPRTPRPSERVQDPCRGLTERAWRQKRNQRRSAEAHRNLILVEFFSKLRCVSTLDCSESHLPGSLEVQSPVVDEKALFRRFLRDLQGNSKNGLIRLFYTQEAGAEKHLEVIPQAEFFNSEPVEFERLVVECAHEVGSGSGNCGDHASCFRQRFRLGKQKAPEFLARECSRSMENDPGQILLERNLSQLEGRNLGRVTFLEIVPVQRKPFGSLSPRMTVPAVAEEDSSNIAKYGGYSRHPLQSLQTKAPG